MRLSNPLNLIVVDRKRLWEELTADKTSPYHLATARNDAADRFIRRLLQGTRRLATEFPELDPTGFRRSLMEAEAAVETASEAPDLDQIAAEVFQRVIDYARQQERLLADREEEVRRILSIVSDAVRQSQSGSQGLLGEVERSVQEIEEVAKLEDLRAVRSRLVRNLQNLRTAAETARAAGDPVADALREVQELRRRLNQVEEAVLRDPLTGAYNRRAFEDRLNEMIAAARPFILVLMDVDRFKEVNDTHGHAVGDRCLKSAATQLRAAFRPADLVSRIGGDEFGVLIDGLEPGQAVGRLDAVFPLRDPACPRVEVSLSFGIAAHESGESAEQLFERADRRLYEAKRTRRRIVFESGEGARSDSHARQLTVSG